jgi:hypothetical protein
MTFDEKRHVIIPLLDELRPYNHAIGSYDKSMFTDSFEYSVKLSNGIIKLPMELVDDYERVRSSVTANRYRSAALAFQSSHEPTPTSKPVAASQPLVTPQPIVKSTPREPANKGWGRIFLKVAIATVVVIAVLYIIGQMQEHRSQDGVEAQKALVRGSIRSYVTAHGSTYQYRRIGGISGLKITVANNTDYNMDMVKVRVAYIKQGGGVYKYEDMEFPDIGAHTAITLPAPDSDRGTSVQFGVESISSKALGL